MRVIKIFLSDEEQEELKRLQKRKRDYRSERAWAVLRCSEGMKATEIALRLKRHNSTVCNWLNAFADRRVEGLKRKYSQGRPSLRKKELIPKLEAYLSKSPRDYGWREDAWSITVIRDQFQRETGRMISLDTVRRALRDTGFPIRKLRRAVPLRSRGDAPKRVSEMAEGPS